MTAWETAWWDRWVGRLEHELHELKVAGYQVVAEDRSSGLLRLEVLAPDAKTGAGDLKLTVTFSDAYPRTAPDVATEDLGMAHHQHPFHGTLCLIGRETYYWDSTTTLADLLDTQLHKAISSGRGEGDDRDELDQGEPFARYYPYQDDAEFLADLTDDLQPGEAGEADFLVDGPFPPPGNGARFIGLIQELRQGRATLHRAPAALTGLFGAGGVRVQGRWVILERPPRTEDAEKFWRDVTDADPRGLGAATLGERAAYLRLVGFPDERSRTERGLSWVVAVRVAGGERRRPRKGGVSGNPAKAAQQQRRPDEHFLLRVDAAGEDHLTTRSPLTAPVADKSVMVVGCGAIGSPLVEQLARAGVKRLSLVDRDVLEPGNLTRHAGTLQHTGLNKTVAMAQHVQSVNPYVEVWTVPMFVGGCAGTNEGQLASEVLAGRMAEVDLVIDASAEVGIAELTADMAHTLGIPWLMLTASEGAAGGTVVCVEPDTSWCFACFQWHRSEGTIPLPVAIGERTVQPTGCAEPTFVGAGFDLAEVSLQAARVAIGRLLRGVPDAYPEDPHDAWVLTMRSADGSRVPPRWDGYTVSRHPNCSAHDA